MQVFLRRWAIVPGHHSQICPLWILCRDDRYPSGNLAGPNYQRDLFQTHYYIRDGDWRAEVFLWRYMTLIALGLSFIARVFFPAYWVSRKELKEEANLLFTA